MDNQNFEMISKYKEIVEKEKPTGYAKFVEIEPTNKQYELGWMYRYFCRQSNSHKAPIREIDKAQFKSYSNPAAGLDRAFYNPLYLLFPGVWPADLFLHPSGLFFLIPSGSLSLVIKKSINIINLKIIY